MEDEIKVICSCGALIPDEAIEHSNHENEEGEHYGEVSAICPACKKEHKDSQWGHWDDGNDPKIYLHKSINNLHKYHRFYNG